MSIKQKTKIIEELTLQYCYLLNNPFLDSDFFKNEANEIYKKFGKTLDSKKNISDYYDFAIDDLKIKIENLKKNNE